MVSTIRTIAAAPFFVLGLWLVAFQLPLIPLINLPSQLRTPISGGNRVCFNKLDRIQNSPTLFRSQQIMHDPGNPCSDNVTSEDGYYASLNKLINSFPADEQTTWLDWIHTTFWFLKQNDYIGNLSVFAMLNGEIPFVALMKNCVNESAYSPSSLFFAPEYLFKCRHVRHSLENVIRGKAYGPVECGFIERSKVISQKDVRISMMDDEPHVDVPFRSDLGSKIIVHAEEEKSFFDWISQYVRMFVLTQNTFVRDSSLIEFTLPVSHIVECFPRSTIHSKDK